MKKFLYYIFIFLLHAEYSGFARIIYVGPTETYTSIKWALSAAGVGDTIIVKEGIYNEGVVVWNSITLISEKLHGAVLGNEPGIVGYIRIKKGSVVVDGFKFGPNGSNFGILAGDLNSTDYVENCIFRNNHITNRQVGINISNNVENTVIQKNVIRGSEQCGIKISGKGKMIVSGNRIEDCPGTGISITEGFGGNTSIFNDTIISSKSESISIRGDSVLVEESVITSGSKQGILIEAGLKEIVIRNSHILQCDETGITINSSSNPLIEGNFIDQNSHAGILVRGEANPWIKANTISKNGFSGVVVEGSARITDNTIKENTQNGIEVLGSSRIEGNTISGNLSDGIITKPGAWGINIEKNHIHNNAWNGIMLSTKAEVFGNLLEENRTGIHIETQESYVIIRDSNEVRTNVEHGICIFRVGHAVIHGNTISGNGTGGDEYKDFSGIFTTGQTEIIGNIIEKNSYGGILVTPGASDIEIREGNEINENIHGIALQGKARVENNSLKNNLENGILVWEEADSSVLYKNLISMNTVGIFIHELAKNISIINCLIKENTRGINSEGEVLLRKNTFDNNERYGLRVNKGNADVGRNLEAEGGYNSFLNNAAWNIINNTPDTVFACYNFWGTDDMLAIDSTLRDNEENEFAGPVIFYPLILKDVTSSKIYPYSGSGSGRSVVILAWPNPFKNRINIHYFVRTTSDVRLWITNIQGRTVGELIYRKMHPPGEYDIIWSPPDLPAQQKSNIYILIIETGSTREAIKIYRLR